MSAARARGVEVILVGSTAVIAQALFPKTSKDADALAPDTMDLDAARPFTADIANEFGATVAEAGWGVLSILPPPGTADWRMDLIVPGEGPIPSEAAHLIRTRAVETPIGWAACPEHVLVMKARSVRRLPRQRRQAPRAGLRKRHHVAARGSDSRTRLAGHSGVASRVS